ncbi:protein NRT1/ PTR FAMILY 8.5-like [Phragmites australis]|uniref:protein NRT1/ PTR FAMILY 8.5-like n=1 Tax=Phragmites australis TaxID=29695 RepID=UPI002D78BB76|nr:protein NRT1/ PTR FAMILY 8.5-like [Phragmites australis]XP_062205413.1 protein NRT1/ PTR FAMILY 8.5-like [Phragmites australis]
MEAADEERPLIHHVPPEDEGSQNTSDGTVDINKQPAPKRSTGNWRACFWILGAEFTECVAFFAISKNLVTYLTGVLHESNVDAARNVSAWIGSCFFTPLIGAFFADTYWGRYWTVVIFFSVYAVGMLTLSVSAFLPLLMDSSYNSGIHRVAAYSGLYLVAIGNGGVKPCTSALGADQFDGADPVERVTKGSFFNWYYFSINIGSLLSGTVLVWVQDNVGWGVGFAIPTVIVVSGLAVFVAGRKLYRYKQLGGSPLTRVSQVVVAAVRNHNLVLPEDCSALHEVPSSTDANYKIEHTSQFRFLDKAAVVAPFSGEKGAAAPTSPWRLCTVSQVEELKMLLRMFPVWASMVLFFAVTAQMSSTFIEQGAVMDNRVGPFSVPPASMAIFDVISVMICIPVYDAVLVPLARRATGKDRGLSQLQRLGVGLALSVVGMVYAALVEARRRALAPMAMSIMWQAPAFAVLGAGEVFTAIGILEFFYDQSPGGMKSLGTALAQLSIATGSYLNSAALGAVAAATARGGKPGWIPDDLNEGHLDYYFWMMAAFGVVNLLHFLHCAIRYRGTNNTAS